MQEDKHYHFKPQCKSDKVSKTHSFEIMGVIGDWGQVKTAIHRCQKCKKCYLEDLEFFEGENE